MALRKRRKIAYFPLTILEAPQSERQSAIGASYYTLGDFLCPYGSVGEHHLSKMLKIAQFFQDKGMVLDP